MIEIQPSVEPLMQWLMHRLSPVTNKLYLAKTRAIDHTDTESPAAGRMLRAFLDRAGQYGFSAICRPLQGDPVRSLDKVRSFPGLILWSYAKMLIQAACDDQIDIMAVQTNAAQSVPTHVMKIIKTVRSSILLFRDEQKTRPRL